MSFPRITYNGKNIDFSVPLRIGSGWNKDVVAMKDRAGSGVTDVLQVRTQHMPNFVLNNVPASEVQQLDDFYDYAEDGSTFTVIMDRTFGGYWGLNDNLKDNDGTAASLTRSNTSDAHWFYNPHTGLMEAVNTANTARFTSGKFARGIIQELAKTNICEKPINMNTSPWVPGVTVTEGTSEVLAPDGTNNACKNTGTANDGNIYTSGTAVGNYASFLIFMKAINDAATIDLGISGSSGNVSSGNLTVSNTSSDALYLLPDGWGAYLLSGDTSAFTGNLIFDYEMQDSNGFYTWGATMVDDQQYLWNPIGATSSASVATNKESFQITLSSDYIDNKQGTIAFWFMPYWDYNNQPNVTNLLWVDSTNSAGRLLSYYITAAGNNEIRLYDTTGTISHSLGGAADTLQAGVWTHIAITWSTVDSGGAFLRLYFNGTQETSDTTPTTAAPGELGTNLEFGNASTNNQCDGVISDIATWKRALNASEIKNIANQGSALGFRRNRMTCRLRDFSRNHTYKNSERYDIVLPFEEVLT